MIQHMKVTARNPLDAKRNVVQWSRHSAGYCTASPSCDPDNARSANACHALEFPGTARAPSEISVRTPSTSVLGLSAEAAKKCPLRKNQREPSLHQDIVPATGRNPSPRARSVLKGAVAVTRLRLFHMSALFDFWPGPARSASFLTCDRTKSEAPR